MDDENHSSPFDVGLVGALCVFREVGISTVAQAPVSPPSLCFLRGLENTESVYKDKV